MGRMWEMLNLTPYEQLQACLQSPSVISSVSWTTRLRQRQPWEVAGLRAPSLPKTPATFWAGGVRWQQDHIYARPPQRST